MKPRIAIVGAASMAMSIGRVLNKHAGIGVLVVDDTPMPEDRIMVLHARDEMAEPRIEKDQTWKQSRRKNPYKAKRRAGRH